MGFRAGAVTAQDRIAVKPKYPAIGGSAEVNRADRLTRIVHETDKRVVSVAWNEKRLIWILENIECPVRLQNNQHLASSRLRIWYARALFKGGCKRLAVGARHKHSCRK